MLEPIYYPQHETAAIAGLIKASAMDAAEVAKVLTETDFFDPYNVVAFGLVQKRREGRISIDPATLRSELALTLSEAIFCGPAAAADKADHLITELFGHAAGTGRGTDLRYHADRVADASRIRRVYDTINAIVATAEEFGHSTAEDAFGGKALAARVQSLAMGMNDGVMDADGHRLDRIVAERAAQLEADYFNPQRKMQGLDTGFPSLNLRIKGLRPGKLIVPMAKPGVGKTSWGLDIVRNTGKKNRAHWQVFSLEMDHEEVCDRMLYQEAEVDAERMGFTQAHPLAATDDPRGMRPGDWANWHAAKARLEGVGERIDVYECAGMTVERIAAVCRQAKYAGRCDAIFVDYLQILETEQKRKNGNRTNELDAIVKSLKHLAGELKAPLISPSQLNKDGVSRESEGIENTADTAMVLEAMQKAEELPDPTESGVDYIVRFKKNRGGSKRPFDMTFRPGMTRFDERSFEANDGTKF